VKSVFTMIMMRFAERGVASIRWIFDGYSLTFGPGAGIGLIGDRQRLG
jgi:Amt family ammonium transporter